MPESLLTQIPEKWEAITRPFLRRANEFEKQQPVVSYFLRTHIAYLCMKSLTKDKDEVRFLKELLNNLENQKRNLSNELKNVDGRTLLTKYALMLFTKADDSERSGQASLDIVRLFFTASVLFDATSQFSDDGEMDPIAKEKYRYAKYIAARMKKALDSKKPYISPNQADKACSSEVLDQCSTEMIGEIGCDENGEPFFQQPPVPRTSDASLSQKFPHLAPLDYATSAPDSDCAGPEKDGHTNENMSGLLRPPLSPQSYTPPNYSIQVQGRTKINFFVGEATTSPMVSGSRNSSSNNNNNNNNNNISSFTVDSDRPLDAILDAQKSVSQAVGALQFYDHENARKFLLKALECLSPCL